MSDITNGVYAELRSVGNGMKMFLKLSRFDIYLMLKLMQFIGRGVKEKIFSNDFSDKFNAFLKETEGEFSIFRVPYKESMSQEEAVNEFKGYLDKVGVKYCIQEPISDDRAIHVCVQQKDIQKFNTIYDNYIRTNLAGGEMDKSDIVNFTDGKTSIMSVPDAYVDDMKNAFREVNINFASLPDLMPNDGVKQLRVANVDLNTAKYVWEDFKRALMQRGQTAENVNLDAEVTGESVPKDVPDISIMSEEEYLNTGIETPEQWMDSASEEIKQKLEEYNQLTPREQYLEIFKWENTIKPSDCFECQALRSNMAFTEISIDKATLVENGSIAEKLNQTSPLRENFFFCTVPGTNREMSLMLQKTLVFEVKDADRERYVAFVDNRRRPHTYDKNGNPDWKYENPKELLAHFDTNKSNEAVESLSKKLMADVPKAAMVK